MMVERRGVIEHPPHLHDVVDFPLADRLVKRRGAVEHRFHRRNGRGIPRADVIVDGR